KRRLDALAERGAAGVDDGGAVALDPHASVVPAADPALLHEQADADAAPDRGITRLCVPPAAQLLVAEPPGCLVHEQSEVAAVVDDLAPADVRAVAIGNPVGRDEVAASQLERLDAEAVCGDVDEPLAREVDLVAARPTG